IERSRGSTCQQQGGDAPLKTLHASRVRLARQLDERVQARQGIERGESVDIDLRQLVTQQYLALTEQRQLSRGRAVALRQTRLAGLVELALLEVAQNLLGA